MKTASIVGAILPQTPVHLAQILNSIFQWVILTQTHLHLTQILYILKKISNWMTKVANQTNNDLG